MLTLNSNSVLSRQHGVVLLLLLLVMVISGSMFMLTAFNGGQARNAEQQEVLLEQMQIAKQTLLSYMANSHLLHLNSRGPGFFPCPDTDNAPDGLPDCISPNSVITTPQIGRLPTHLSAAPPDMEFNSYFSDVDRQFWYVVAPRYYYNSNNNATPANSRRSRDRTSGSSTYNNLRLSVDGTSGYIALIIAPGEALENQQREAYPTTASHYIESQDSNFAFSSAATKSSTNDVILGITFHEFMYAAGLTAAIEMKKELDAQGATYTSSQSTFRSYLTNSSDHAWLKSTSTTGTNRERWSSDTTYTRLTTTSARINFSGCTGITYTLYINGGIEPAGSSC